MFLSGLLGSSSNDEQNEADGPGTVERIIDRIESASMLQDRRDACRALRSLARTYRVEVGAQGMPSLIKILDQDRSDTETVNLALEALFEVICEQDQLGEQFTEIFIKDQYNVGILLDLIEEHDFSVRWSAIKLLSGLVSHQTKQMQTVVLGSPMGISRLMDLLSDSREVIRNDTLLMLTSLTKSNANIQKIVAFESAFDRLLDIISSEGYADGGIVVEDSLNIMLNLLQNNISNLNYFKEGAYIARLVDFFANLNSLGSEWSQSKVTNVLVMYRVIRSLVCPNNPTNVSRSCQASLRKNSLLSMLCETLMASGVPAHVLWETINTVAEVIRGCPENQAVFKAVQAPSSPPTPAVLLLLMSMLNEKQPLDLRCAILYCFQCYVHGNAELQGELIEQFDSAPEGKLLHQGLLSKESMCNWLSSMAISYCIADKKSLDHVITEVSGFLKNQNATNQSRIGYLILITTWLSGSESNVSKFVNSTDNISYLTSELCLPSNEQQEAIVQSLCAVVLAVCIVFNDNTVDAFNKAALRTLIINRVGKDAFVEKLAILTKQPCYTAAIRSPQIVAEQTLLDYNICSSYRTMENMIHRCLEDNDLQQQHIDELKRIIRQQEQLIAQFRNSHSIGLPSSTSTSTPSLVPMYSTSQTSAVAPGPPIQKVAPVVERTYYDEYQQAKQRITDLESDLHTKTTQLEDLLILLVDQDTKLKEYAHRLRALGEPVLEIFEEGAGDVGVQQTASELVSSEPIPVEVLVPPMEVIDLNASPPLGPTSEVELVPNMVLAARIQPLAAESHMPLMSAPLAELLTPQLPPMQSAPMPESHMVQFYNPANMFQPVELITEMPVAMQPMQPPSGHEVEPPRPASTVSSSAAELAGGGRDPEANDGFEMIPTPTQQVPMISNAAQLSGPQHAVLTPVSQVQPVIPVYPFQQTPVGVPYHQVPTSAGIQLFIPSTQMNPQGHYMESFYTPSLSQAQQIPTQFVPPMLPVQNAPVHPVLPNLPPPHIQPEMHPVYHHLPHPVQHPPTQQELTGTSLPPARALFGQVPPTAASLFPGDSGVSML